jgi:7,8-dihydropterin-6-yl-methyl-4-(beta-D-ribofuranosyl)aminobenzene 5'-phosphate synthase
MSLRYDFTRRCFIRSGLVLGSTVLLNAPLARLVSPARAALSDVPVVDRLRITIVTDSYYDMLAPNVSLPLGVEVERRRGNMSGEHGLAMFIESERGDEAKAVMLDFGWTPEVYLGNLERLGLDVGRVEAFVVSHGHDDHYGGLMGLLNGRREAMADQIPLYIGGDDALCQRWSGPAEQRVDRGRIDRDALHEKGVSVVQAESGAIVAGHGFTSGVIERTSIEETLPNTTVEVGAGCTGEQHQAHFTPDELEGKFLFDHHWGEHATAYHVRDRGLVVTTSCGHAGLINSVRQAQKASGVEKVHAVLGGFHLSPAAPDYVETVIDALVAEVDPDYVIPMHCTGANFSYIMSQKYPEKLIQSYVGTAIVFGA